MRWPVYSVSSHRMVTDLADQGVAPRQVVDVGANRGQFSIAALHVWPKATVVAFEPIPEAAAKLREVSQQWPSRLTVVESAVGGSSGTVPLHVNAHLQASSILEVADRHLRAFPVAVPKKSVSVALTTLDDALANIELRQPALLKIDVQGFERDVLQGAAKRLPDFNHLVVETSFRPLYQGEWTFLELVDYLRARGFQFLRPVGQLRDPETGEYLQIDALFEKVS